MVLTLESYASDLSVALPDAMAGCWAMKSSAIELFGTTHKFSTKQIS